MKYTTIHLDQKFTLDNPQKKTIIITGSTKGIGLELAKNLSNKESYQIVINSRHASDVEDIISQLSNSQTQSEIIGIVADISQPDGNSYLVEQTLNYFGKIDFLVNNAVLVTDNNPLHEKDLVSWNQELATNLSGILSLSQRVIAAFKQKNPGLIINISSGASLCLANEDSNSYAIQKLALERMTQALALETYPDHIGLVGVRIDDAYQTSLTKKFADDYSELDHPSKLIPIFDYLLAAPLAEITGRIISTTLFLSNPNLGKLTPNINSEDPVDFDFNFLTNLPPGKNIMGNNPLGSYPSIEKLSSGIDLSTYPQDGTELKKTIAQKLNIAPECINFHQGSSGAILDFVSLLVPPYHNAICVHRGWDEFDQICHKCLVEIQYANYPLSKDNFYQPDFEQIVQLINPHTRLIYLVSPGGITGQSIDSELFDQFLAKIPSNIPIIIDHTYQEYSQNPRKVNAAKYLNRKDRIIIGAMSFSKFYGLAGIRLGYSFVRQDIASLLNSHTLSFPLDKWREQLALTVIKDQSHADKVLQYIDQERKKLAKILKASNINYFPSETNSILVQLKFPIQVLKKQLEIENIYLDDDEIYFDQYYSFLIEDSVTNDKVINTIVKLHKEYEDHKN